MIKKRIKTGKRNKSRKIGNKKRKLGENEEKRKLIWEKISDEKNKMVEI